MPKPETPYAKDELMLFLEQSYQDVRVFFAELDDATFFRPQGEAWSPAQHLDHLCRAVAPLAQAMVLPKLVLRFRFGKGPGTSRTYDEIREVYLAGLERGVKARGRFLPTADVDDPTRAADVHKERLRDWQRAGHALISATTRWREEHLDGYFLPHPAIGKLTIREMLFFTLYHNRHHLERVRSRLTDG